MFKDLEEIGVIVKHMNLINYAYGFLFMHKAWKRCQSHIEFTSLMSNAIFNFQEALNLMSNNIEIMQRINVWSSFYVKDIAEVLFGMQRYEEAEYYYKKALQIDGKHGGILYKYAVFLKQPKVNRVLEADEYFRKVLVLEPWNQKAYQYIVANRNLEGGQSFLFSTMY